MRMNVPMMGMMGHWRINDSLWGGRKEDWRLMTVMVLMCRQTIWISLTISLCMPVMMSIAIEK
ncbi:hypothetical protein [Legionella erythra]|nr:hypothetical protein [Legionella erythra]